MKIHNCVLVSLVFVIMLCGCTSTYMTYELPNGSKLTIHRRTLLSKVQMPDLEIPMTNGVITLKGYSNDGGSESVNGIVEAATKGAVKGVTGK